MTICDFEIEMTVNIILVFLFLIAFFLFLTALVFHIRYSKTFHPIYRVTLCNIIVFIMLCRGSSIVYLFASFPNLRNETVLSVINYFFMVTYSIISPQVVIALLERVYATVYANSYETYRPWKLYIVAQLIGVALVLINYTIHTEFLQGLSHEIVQLAVSSTVTLSLLILFFVNRKLQLNSLGKRTLVARYQFNENVRVLRILTVLAICDTTISVIDSFSRVLWNINWYYEGSKCQDPEYFWLFVAIRVLSLLVEYSMPLPMIIQYKCIHETMINPPPVESSSNAKDNYFEQLHRQWK